jgi:ubiquinol-cytochrome c reductase cytochrome c subunit
VKRWLIRRSRVPVALQLALAVALGALALAGLATPSGQAAASAPAIPGGPLGGGPTALAKSPDPPGPGDPTRTFPSSPMLIAQGYDLYQDACSSCHGIALQGMPGVAPSLRGVGPGPVDFYLSTGRMPLENPREEPQRAAPQFRRGEISALIAYVSSFGGPPAPVANAGAGDLALGFHQFTLHCAGCHQIVARGGLTLGAFVPDLEQATAQQVAEAVRMGPYVMPHFDYRQIDQHKLDSIARYVLWTQHPNNAGGWSIGNIGPIPEGMVAWFLALAAMVLVARLIGERLA